MSLILNVKKRNPAENSALTDTDLKAVVYGGGSESRPILISKSDFLHLFKDVKYSSLFDLIIDGGAPVKALFQEVQVNPVSMDPIHVDLIQIRMDQAMTLDVPLEFIGESKAMKMGGTLNKPYEEIEVECLPDKLPKSIEVDLSKLETYEDRITAGNLVLPEGVKITLDPEELIVSVDAPLSEEDQKKLEEANIGDVAAVTSEADEKKGEEEGKEGEAEAGKTEKPA
ncbi:50S ribosomal protein L25 [Patescibacteria group bacterium]|nr:50S ribosomal protein L25 [Patescibacteria group bacterium]